MQPSTSPYNHFLELECAIRNYPWGQTSHDGGVPYIAELLDLEVDDHRPYAELWMGAHPSAPAKTNGVALDQLIAANQQEILGSRVLNAGFTRLPFLMKILSCELPLSIQAHPDLTLARRLHERDPENYPDANHKPEISVALTKFEALCGFRPQADIQADLKRLPPLQELIGEPPQNDWLRQAYARLFRASKKEIEDAGNALDAMIAQTQSPLQHDLCFSHLWEKHSNDRGALSAYFLNYVQLDPGEAVFMAANEPHAYLNGVIIECMASSDNVVRAGLTSKFVDVETLLDMLTYRDALPEILPGEPCPGGRHYAAPVPEFDVVLYDWESGEPGRLHSNDAVSLLLVLDGEIETRLPGHPAKTFSRGSILLWPAALESAEFFPKSPNARMVRAYPSIS